MISIEWHDPLKAIHITAVILSISGFIVRTIAMLAGAAWLQKVWAKKLPQLVDTILLLAAIFLAIRASQYPFVHAWLTAKIIALILYIGLGTVALHYGKSITIRLVSAISAITCFAYIVWVALTRLPNPWILI